MIVGQLIQAGKRYCEYRSAESLPTSDSRHTFLAYNVMDTLDAKTFDDSESETPNAIRKWLTDCDSVAYIVISRNFDCRQVEFPTPIGRDSQKTITITAATSACLGQMSFVTYGEISERPLKLINNRSACSKVDFTLTNYFSHEATDNISGYLDFGQFIFPQFQDTKFQLAL